jgi:uncharacterized protein
MPRLVGIDSGPLASLFDRSDKHHVAAKRFFAASQDRGFVTVAVMTEVMYLLDFRVDAQRHFLEWLREGALDILSLEATDLERIIELTGKYSSLPLDFADATLVAACERLNTRLIASIDSHFTIYRFRNRQPFENLFIYDQ